MSLNFYTSPAPDPPTTTITDQPVATTDSSTDTGETTEGDTEDTNESPATDTPMENTTGAAPPTPLSPMENDGGSSTVSVVVGVVVGVGVVLVLAVLIILVLTMVMRRKTTAAKLHEHSGAPVSYNNGVYGIGKQKINTVSAHP